MRLAHLSVLALAGASCLPAVAQSSSGASNQYLNGQYAFLLKGVTLKTTSNQPVLTTLIGSFTADGAGHITSGIAAINSAQVTMTNMAITGVYNIKANGTGTLAFTTPLGSTNYVLSVLANPTGTLQSGLATSLAAPTGGGSFHLQNPATFSFSSPALQTGQFLVDLNGETACTDTCLTSGTGPAYVSSQGMGTVHLNSPVAGSAGYMSLPVVVTAGTSYTTTDVSGALSAAGPRGGRVLTLTRPGLQSGGIRRIAFYQYDVASFYVMTLDPHATVLLESGSAEPAQ